MIPMYSERIFLDANVLFSVAYGSKGLERLWQKAEKGDCVLLASQYVTEEAKRNLEEPHLLERLNHFLNSVQIFPEVGSGIPCAIDLPEKDCPVLLAAMAAKADYLLTGDVTHFGKYFGKTVSGVNICRPGDYLSDKE